MGIVYGRTSSSSTISMPVAKLRMGAFRSGKVPSSRNSRKSAAYPLISLLVGSSVRRCSPAAGQRIGGEPAKLVVARSAGMLDAGQGIWGDDAIRLGLGLCQRTGGQESGAAGPRWLLHGQDSGLEVWPESLWPSFALRESDVFRLIWHGGACNTLQYPLYHR